jgi:hypothetical protein
MNYVIPVTTVNIKVRDQQNERISHLGLGNHLIDIAAELVSTERFGKEAELLLPDGVVHIEDDPRAERGHIEAVDLLLAHLGLVPLEEVGRHLGADEERDLAAEDGDGEDAAEALVLPPDQRDGPAQEAHQPAHHRRRGNGRRQPLAAGAQPQQQLDEGNGGHQERRPGDEEFLLVAREIHRLLLVRDNRQLHGLESGHGACRDDAGMDGRPATYE